MNQNIEGEIKYERWGLRNTLLWCLVILTVYFFVYVIVIIIYMLLSPQGLDINKANSLANDLAKSGNVFVVGTVASMIICTGLMLGIARLKKNSNLVHYFGLNRFDIKQFYIWFSLFVFYAFLSYLFRMLCSSQEEPDTISNIYKTSDSKLLFFIVLIFSGPLLEEMFFRGFLFEGLANSFFGTKGAIFITALLWASIHTQYDYTGILSIFVLGLILGLCKTKTNSIFLPMTLHCINNSISAVWLYFEVS